MSRQIEQLTCYSRICDSVKSLFQRILETVLPPAPHHHVPPAIKHCDEELKLYCEICGKGIRGGNHEYDGLTKKPSRSTRVRSSLAWANREATDMAVNTALAWLDACCGEISTSEYSCRSQHHTFRQLHTLLDAHLHTPHTHTHTHIARAHTLYTHTHTAGPYYAEWLALLNRGGMACL